MKKATRKKLIEWLITFALLVLLALVVYYRFFVAPKNAAQPGPEWRPLEPVATVETAETLQARATGLMGRESLAADSGMYFKYPDEHSSPFHMKNTPVRLSIAFIGKDGGIVDIKDMQPYTLTPVYPGDLGTPPRYMDALEMNQGWFERNGIRVGDRAELKDGEVHFSRYAR
jgi:uncharacterized membrane protein (UPF0127 family)